MVWFGQVPVMEMPVPATGVGVAVPVPPFATATMPLTFAAVPVVLFESTPPEVAVKVRLFAGPVSVPAPGVNPLMVAAEHVPL